MVLLKKACALFFLFFISLPGFAQGTPQTTEKTGCLDGVIYKICQDQLEIYKTLLADAKQKGQRILIVFGFETCPWCVSLNRIFKSEAGQSILDKKNLKLIEVGVQDSSGNTVLSGFRLQFQALAQSIEPPKRVLINGEAYPLIVLVDPAKRASFLISTGRLEKNTKRTRGHDIEKIEQALDDGLRSLNDFQL